MTLTLTKQRRLSQKLMAVAAALTLTLTACSGNQSSETEMSADASSSTANAQATETFFTTDRVHEIDVELDDDDYQEMLSTYATSGDKEWLSVTITIDGTTYRDAGLRLKGNKSLRTALASQRGIELSDSDLEGESDSDSDNANAADPATIPWLVRLDKFVDDQQHLGRTDFVVRGNDTESSLNEAVAVAMLEEAGLPAHRVGFTSFSISGGDPVLRLVSEVPDDELWNQEWFGSEGSTWKADSEGDWDYHGEDGADYEDIWKQRTGEDDMTPVVEFMDFINNSSDQAFAEELPEKLDVEEFATYLATEKLLGNTDTISGPGNNGYLHYEPSTGQMIVVPWDHDMVFGGMGMGGPGGGAGPGDRGDDTGMGGPGGGRPSGGMGGMEPPEGMELPEGMEPPGDMGGMEPPEGMELPEDMADFDPGQMGAPGGGGFGGSNVLEERFLEVTKFNELYQERYQALREELIESGFATQVLNQYAELLVDQAADLISAETVESERASIESYLESDSARPQA